MLNQSINQCLYIYRAVNKGLQYDWCMSRTCQTVNYAAAVYGAVGGAGLVENFFVRQRLLQYCQSHTHVIN